MTIIKVPSKLGPGSASQQSYLSTQTGLDLPTLDWNLGVLIEIELLCCKSRWNLNSALYKAILQKFTEYENASHFYQRRIRRPNSMQIVCSDMNPWRFESKQVCLEMQILCWNSWWKQIIELLKKWGPGNVKFFYLKEMWVAFSNIWFK